MTISPSTYIADLDNLHCKNDKNNFNNYNSELSEDTISKSSEINDSKELMQGSDVDQEVYFYEIKPLTEGIDIEKQKDDRSISQT